MAAHIVVVDYHKGNLLSVARSLGDAGGEVEISDDPAAVASADGVVVPGVGSFGDAMLWLNEAGMANTLRTTVAQGIPYLGICLGLQLLFDKGGELGGNPGKGGWVEGLGILPGSVTRLPSTRLKVPHVGWDQIYLTQKGRACPLLTGVAEGANVYFTHSYALDEDVPASVVAAQTHYGTSFASAVWQRNVFGVQFHPEKSSSTGLAVLKNFVQIVNDGACK